MPKPARLLVLVLALAVSLVPATGAWADAERTERSGRTDGTGSTARPGERLHLVTMDDRGLATRPDLRGAPERRTATRARLRSRQDAALATVGSPAPVYRWTSALSGVAVRLAPAEAEALRRAPGVAGVQPDAVLPIAGSPGGAGRPTAPVRGDRRDGEGVVVGVVDSGLFPEGPVFAPLGSGGRPARFAGRCRGGPDWPASRCSSKVVAASWFVEGFGRDRLRSTARLSPADDLGHGTQTASVVAGNAGVGVRVRDRQQGRFRGVAPRARLAVYKACWAAPDPADDGCATADLVTAVDRAVADRVDVLTLPVAAPPRAGALRAAVLGAAEADVAAVGPAAAEGAAAPWITTVGSARGSFRTGTVELDGGPTLPGAMLARHEVGPAPLRRGADVATAGTPRRAAALCRPGSLDAARVAGAVVVCRRGEIGHVEKAATVARADGVGMVLTQRGPGALVTDFHAVPTVHLGAGESAELRRSLEGRRRARAALVPSPGTSQGPARGSERTHPDLVAPATGVLGALPPGPAAARWGFFSGPSAASATTAGVVAALRGRRPGWSAARVRSAVTTSARPLGAPVARQGAGLLAPRAARRPGLVLDRPSRPNRAAGGAPAAAISLPGPGRRTRTLTRVGAGTATFSARVVGFDDAAVTVTPATLRLAPGESARVTVAVRGAGRDGGHVVWRGSDGTRVRLPVTVRE